MPGRTAKKSKRVPAGKKRPPAVSAAPAAMPAQQPRVPDVRVPAPAPRKPSPPPLPRPTRSASKTSYHSAVVFGLGVIAAAVLLFAVVRDISVSRTPSPRPQEDDQVFAAVRKHADFKSWAAKWRDVDPYVNVSEFMRVQAGAISAAGTPDAAVTPTAEQLATPMADRYVWSPEKSRFVDYLADFGEPDSSVQIFNRDGNGKLETLAFCGTPCRFDRAFWLDEDRAVVLGVEEGVKADGSPLCLPSSGADGGALRCYQRLNVAVYDFAHGTRTTYRSENHLFATQPFGQESKDRWASGLSPEQRAVLGLDLGGDVESVAGTIGEIAEDARILTLVGGRVPRIVTVADAAPIRDEQGKLLPFSALARGFEVEAQAVARPDGTVVAASLRIVRAPNIIVSAPRDGGTAGPKFSITGIARVFEGNVRIRITNGRTLKTVLDGFATAAAPDAGLFGPFTFKVSLPSGSAKKGDLLMLEAFDTSAADGTEKDKVLITLRYAP